MQGIYTYFDRKNGRIVYVGKDSHIDKKSRHNVHMAKSHYDNQPINRILQNNPERYSYDVVIEGDFDDDVLNTLEEYYIYIYNTYEDSTCFNYTEGGEGTSGYKHSDETRAKMSEVLSGEKNPFYGKKHSDEARAKIIEANKGKIVSAETRAKISAAKKGKTLSAETRAKISKATSGEKNHNWKDHARVIKNGFINGKQMYGLKYKSKTIKHSIDKSKLEKLAVEINNAPAE